MFLKTKPIEFLYTFDKSKADEIPNVKKLNDSFNFISEFCGSCFHGLRSSLVEKLGLCRLQGSDTKDATRRRSTLVLVATQQTPVVARCCQDKAQGPPKSITSRLD